MNKETIKRIILFFIGVVALVIFLLPAIENFKTKEQYEQQKQNENKIKYERYFGGNNDK